MKYIKLFENWISIQKTSVHSDNKMKDFIEGLQLHLEKMVGKLILLIL